MEFLHRPRLWRGPPLAWQIVGLLLGGLVVAQLVTLLLTLLLPPEPQPQYNLNDIAGTLAGRARLSGALQRVVQAAPPAPMGPGWLTSERSRQDLARLIGEDEDDVRLYFYTPLPFAGTAGLPQRGVERDASQRQAREEEPPLPPGFMRAQFQVQPSTTPGFPGGGFPGGFPGGGFPGSVGSGFPAVAGAARIPGGFPGGFSSAIQAVPRTMPSAPVEAPSITALPAARMAHPPDGGASFTDGSQVGGILAAPLSASPAVRAPHFTVGVESAVPSFALSSRPTPMPLPAIPGNLPAVMPPLPDSITPKSEHRHEASIAPLPLRPRILPGIHAPAVMPPVTLPHAPAIVSRAPAARVAAPRPDQPSVPVIAPSRGLFGLAPAPFVEGDFIAALRLANGQWAVVQPVPEPFPNAWQRRVLLWFLISFALVAPLGWMFARRLVHPISGFALAAEQLGRDPTAPILALAGPAEVGRAAHAFNRMQSRLRSFVDDRTAMVGAISHDLRTPLTRLRFRIEDVPEELQAGMLAEVDEMEQMISSVLSFIRDASEPGSRERLDLRSILEDVVEDAVFIGKHVTLEDSEHASVDVDPLGMRRLLGNLVENAVKYGDSARVRLFTDRHDAVAEVRDNGPGLPDEELERVFQPFYRAPAARASNKLGTGLGLAVCRSIARAHGGDVQLMRSDHGLVAQVRLPLAYGMADA